MAIYYCNIQISPVPSPIEHHSFSVSIMLQGFNDDDSEEDSEIELRISPRKTRSHRMPSRRPMENGSTTEGDTPPWKNEK